MPMDGIKRGCASGRAAVRRLYAVHWHQETEVAPDPEIKHQPRPSDAGPHADNRREAVRLRWAGA